MTPVLENPVVKPAGTVEVNSAASTNHQEGQSSGVPASEAQQITATNPGTGTTQQQQEKREDILLMGYPDVETNVNTKFHGWEIAQDPCYPSGSVSHESAFKTGCHNNDNNNDNPGSDETNSDSSSTSTKASTSSGTTTASSRGFAASAASTASESEPSQESAVEQKATEESDIAAQSRVPRITLELDDWLIDHPGGRYYFTNGEKDPWKELTLASSRALEFLSRPKVGSWSGSISDSKDVGADDKKRSRKRVTSKQHSTVPEGPLESAELPESSLQTSIETGQGGERSSIRLVPQDATDDKQDDDPEVVSKEFLSPASPIDATSTSSQHRDSYSHKGKRRHRHHYHRPRHHQHKHHHRRRKRLPKNTACTQSIVDPCQFIPSPTPSSRGRGDIDTTLSQSKLSGQDEDVAGVNSSSGSDGATGVLVEVEIEVDEPEKEDEGGGTLAGNSQIIEDEYGDRTVMRIISDASHCQDILYESSDLNSVQLRTEREHVLKTFVRWIEIDDRRQQRALERRQKQQLQCSDVNVSTAS
ncbi:hypothetical protein BGZ97_002539 [Linnemannia gamsii]|uniref:Uncharacterized protein n=1 Tax=Linnemannia gamsii TaxID=64522 RepID=A0A9P6UIE4_9FUNG|nr:hypothetical protein BGZ97_002539 [Linnemannia gamsii]